MSLQSGEWLSLWEGELLNNTIHNNMKEAKRSLTVYTGTDLVAMWYLRRGDGMSRECLANQLGD